MRETPHWAGDVARPEQDHVCPHALRLFLIRDIRLIRGHIHCLEAAAGRGQPGSANFCVLLRGLRAPSVKPPGRKGTQSSGIPLWFKSVPVPDFSRPSGTKQGSPSHASRGCGSGCPSLRAVWLLA